MPEGARRQVRRHARVQGEGAAESEVRTGGQRRDVRRTHGGVGAATRPCGTAGGPRLVLTHHTLSIPSRLVRCWVRCPPGFDQTPPPSRAPTCRPHCGGGLEFVYKTLSRAKWRG